MKKGRSVLIIISVFFFVVLISGVMLETEVEKLNEDFNKTGYIKIDHFIKSYEITDKKVINAIIQEISCLELKKRHPYKEFISDCDIRVSPNKYAFYIKAYDEKGNEELFELTIRSNDYMEINGDEYKIKTDTCIYDILRCYTITHYTVGLPNITEDNISEFRLQGGIEYTKEDFIENYEDVRGSKIITKNEFEYSDTSISIKTVDEQFIDIYFVGDKLYTRYRKNKYVNEHFDRVKKKYGDIISEWEIDCYYVLE